MVKKLLTLLFVSALAVPLSTALFAQDAPAKQTAAKEVRLEGRIQRSSPDKSMLTVRKAGMNIDRDVQYDSSTTWVSQFHGEKKAKDIDSSQVKDGDYVICKGKMDKAGVLHATLISKRLSHSPAK